MNREKREVVLNWQAARIVPGYVNPSLSSACQPHISSVLLKSHLAALFYSWLCTRISVIHNEAEYDYC